MKIDWKSRKTRSAAVAGAVLTLYVCFAAYWGYSSDDAFNWQSSFEGFAVVSLICALLFFGCMAGTSKNWKMRAAFRAVILLLVGAGVYFAFFYSHCKCMSASHVESWKSPPILQKSEEK